MRTTLAALGVPLLAFLSPAVAGSDVKLTNDDVPIPDPARGADIGPKYTSYLHPFQEPGEDKDTPAYAPKEFVSQQPSLTRAQLTKAGLKGAGNLFFRKDFYFAEIAVKIEGVNMSDISMFHLHCGEPDTLGPVLVDFGLFRNTTDMFDENGVFRFKVTSKEIVETNESGQKGDMAMSVIMGCPILAPTLSLPVNVSTVAGMQYLAQQGQLYFNLHTNHQQYFGALRGQVVPYDG